MGKLFPTRTIFNALGCLLKDPALLENSKIRLNRSDFTAHEESRFHVMIFATINNLYDKGVVSIQPADVDEYLSDYRDQYQIFDENDGIQWCYEAIDMAETSNYDFYAEKIKKFSLLRELDSQGIGLEGIYEVSDDPDEQDEVAQAKFDELSVDDIINFVEKKVSEISTAYQIGYDRQTSKAGDNGIELLESFKEAPMYGFDSIGEMQNTIFRGMLPKTSLLRSGYTNTGKTRLSIGEATDAAIGKWFVQNKRDWSKSKWESKGKKHKVLFISTEMEEDELQPTMWAYISGVPEERIRDGNLMEEEEEAVRQAILHLQECDLFIEYVPKFDPQTINAIIKEYAVRHEIDIVYFDYIHLSFEIMMEISSKTRGMTMREDMMLTIFAAGLEELAREYSFHLRTSTQMNGERVEAGDILDQRLLRGAKAMADKMQYGVILARPTSKEIELVKPIMDNAKGFGKEEPNLVYHIYKNRKSKWKGKLWIYVDFDTMRQTELFFTDFEHNKLNVPLTNLLEEIS